MQDKCLREGRKWRQALPFPTFIYPSNILQSHTLFQALIWALEIQRQIKHNHYTSGACVSREGPTYTATHSSKYYHWSMEGAMSNVGRDVAQRKWHWRIEWEVKSGQRKAWEEEAFEVSGRMKANKERQEKGAVFTKWPKSQWLLCRGGVLRARPWNCPWYYPKEQGEKGQWKLLYRKQNVIVFSFRKVIKGRVRAGLERKKLSTGRPVQLDCCKDHPRNGLC